MQHTAYTCICMYIINTKRCHTSCHPTRSMCIQTSNRPLIIRENWGISWQCASRFSASSNRVFKFLSHHFPRQSAPGRNRQVKFNFPLISSAHSNISHILRAVPLWPFAYVCQFVHRVAPRRAEMSIQFSCPILGCVFDFEDRCDYHQSR